MMHGNCGDIRGKGDKLRELQRRRKEAFVHERQT